MKKIELNFNFNSDLIEEIDNKIEEIQDYSKLSIFDKVVKNEKSD